jgi:hypothetical protein
VQASLDAAAAGRTTVTVAHRLAAVVNADIIAVLDAGRVVEQGTHGELVAAGGAYARLAALQATRGEGADVVREKLAPSLSEIVANERSNELSTAALIALARCGDPAPDDPQQSLVPVLRARLGDTPLVVAYNEFCAPSLDDAVAAARAGPAAMMLGGGGFAAFSIAIELASPWLFGH